MARRIVLIIVAGALLIASVIGQGSSNGEAIGQSTSFVCRRVYYGTTLPATCRPNGINIFFKTDTGELHLCTAPDTWTPIGSGGGTPGGSDTQVQYNNAGAFGGISGFTSNGTNVTAGSGNLRATLPQFTTGIADANGNEMFLFTPTASAVNEFNITNAATGGIPSISASGGDTNISIDITPKGTGVLSLTTGSLRVPDGTSSAPSIARGASSTTGFRFVGAGNAIHYVSATTPKVALTGTLLYVASGHVIGFSSNTDTTVASADSGIARQAASVLKATDGGTTNLGWFYDAGIKRVSTQFDKTDTTLANITGLSVDVRAGRSYSFEANLFIDTDVTGGSKYAIGGTATATAIIYQIQLFDNATNAITINTRQTALGGSTGQAGTTAGLVRIKGVITVNAAGTLTVQFAQNAASGTSSVLVGSDFIVRDNP